MVREPEHGWLVTAPTSSPENEFYVSKKDRTPISVCMGPTMDIQLVRELYTHVIEAASILHTDSLYANQLKEASAQLPPHQISKKGYLMDTKKRMYITGTCRICMVCIRETKSRFIIHPNWQKHVKLR